MARSASDTTAAQYDAVAVGCGPFNLGFAALASTLSDLSVAVFEAAPELRWHPGLMFDDARLQLSFLADLVTLVDPTHPLSFLAYVRDRDRMYPFFIREQFHPTRREYEDYLRWAASGLSSLRFSERVTRVAWQSERQSFSVEVASERGSVQAFTKHVVIGIGTEPFVPGSLRELMPEGALHSADYLREKPRVTRARHVTLIGSGQSAAEIMVDLLRENLAGGAAVTWLTRTASFAPLDYSKLVLEMTTPAYVRYFHQLPESVRDRLVAEQWRHYKGISGETLEQIHELLYARELERGLQPVVLQPGVTVERGRRGPLGEVSLTCRHSDTGSSFEQATDLAILATGYRERKPDFLAPLEPLLLRDERGRARVRLDYSLELDPMVTGKIFVANAELHSHGVATPDLGMGAYRNGVILNTITGREAYRLPWRTAFSRFDGAATAALSDTYSAAAGSAPALEPRLAAEPPRRLKDSAVHAFVHDQTRPA